MSLLAGRAWLGRRVCFLSPLRISIYTRFIAKHKTLLAFGHNGLLERSFPHSYSAMVCCFDSTSGAVLVAVTCSDGSHVLVAFDAKNVEGGQNAFRWARRFPYGSITGLCVPGSQGVVIASSFLGRKLLALDTSNGILVSRA